MPLYLVLLVPWFHYTFLTMPALPTLYAIETLLSRRRWTYLVLDGFLVPPWLAPTFPPLPAWVPALPSCLPCYLKPPQPGHSGQLGRVPPSDAGLLFFAGSRCRAHAILMPTTAIHGQHHRYLRAITSSS